MKQFYTGTGQQHDRGLDTLPLSHKAEMERPEHYRADTGLVAAVNIALNLAQPLLLTGDPGTGKTQLAYAVDWELCKERIGPNGRPPENSVLRYNATSTTEWQNLFYSFDALGWFNACRAGGSELNPRRYLRFTALGKALLLSRDEAYVRSWIPDVVPWRADQAEVERKRNWYDGPRRALVLIDEIDKAPRDVPNDLLNQIMDHRFTIEELVPHLGEDGATVEGDPGKPPVMVFTSNSEKGLPDAFLRRCIYYDIPRPTGHTLREILVRRLGSRLEGNHDMLGDAVAFLDARELERMDKRPATAEALNWLMVLLSVARESGVANLLREKLEAVKPTLTTLAKTKRDSELIRDFWDKWEPAKSLSPATAQ